ncbi:hypothetical protein H5410_045930 [Solanum commersonii]|uniref:Uncharacterized protein n=1 Tax=Solanum commersonii TaxID=4109 RepID=A0A9J5XF30_SOLCO|nr:hypothetical protein H5410_045930 [Solanum commersonii]
MLLSDGPPTQMARLDSASSSQFQYLPTKTHCVPNSHILTTLIFNSFVDIIKVHGTKDKEKAIADVELIPMKKSNLIGVVGKPIQLDLATINKTRLSCGRVKVNVDLLAEKPKFVQMQLEDENTLENRGHGEEDCRVPHPELVQQYEERPKAAQQLSSM